MATLKTFTTDGVVLVQSNMKMFTVDGIVKITNLTYTFTVDGVITDPTNSTGFFLNGVKLKNPIAFQRDYVYRRTDTLVMSGGSVRDFSGLKQQYILKFKNLTSGQVSAINAIMALGQKVSFKVTQEAGLQINVTVWPYIGSITYQRLGSDYLADATINLIDADVS